MEFIVKTRKCLKTPKKCLKSKKGSLVDVIMYTIIMFVLGIFIIFGYKLMSIINDEIQANPDLSTSAKEIMSSSESRYVSLFDGIFITVFVLLGVVIVVGAYFVYMHPVFYVPSLFIMVFLILLAAILANVFYDVTTTGDLVESRDHFTMIKFIMGTEDNPHTFVPFIVVLGFMVLIVSYAKYSSENI